MVWLTKNSQHSNKDITVENVRVSIDGSSISREKYDLEVQTPVEEISDQNTDDGHPDGGLTAWLVVAGVCLPSLLRLHNLIILFSPFLRQCVIQARRKYFNQLVLPTLSSSFFIFHIPRKQKSRAL
jgi:hypothetical protein